MDVLIIYKYNDERRGRRYFMNIISDNYSVLSVKTKGNIFLRDIK